MRFRRWKFFRAVSVFVSRKIGTDTCSHVQGSAILQHRNFFVCQCVRCLSTRRFYSERKMMKNSRFPYNSFHGTLQFWRNDMDSCWKGEMRLSPKKMHFVHHGRRNRRGARVKMDEMTSESSSPFSFNVIIWMVMTKESINYGPFWKWVSGDASRLLSRRRIFRSNEHPLFV